MIRSILLPLDGSEFAERALPLATGLARRRSARLHLVTVNQPMLADGMQWRLGNGEARTALARYLDERAAGVREAGVDDVATAVLEGEPAKALEAYVRDQGVDFVVMTTHGLGGLFRAWIGSVADRLIRHAPVPVLLVRPDGRVPEATGEAGPFRRVLVPLDGSGLAERVLPTALELGDDAGAEYRLLRVVLPPFTVSSPYLPHSVHIDDETLAQFREDAEQYLAEVAGRIAGEGRRVETEVVVEGSAAQAILERVRRDDADLIALATHGRGGLARTLLGSVADKVVRAADTPVLVYRPERPAEA